MSWTAALKNCKSGDARANRLDAMVRACREADEGAELSSESRDRILNAALRDSSEAASLPAVFTPTRRLLLAGTLPIVLAVALLVGFDRGVTPPAAPTETGPAVAVFKQGDRVFFDIRNGAKRHTVRRSTSPDRFDGDSGVPVTDGAYTEGLQDQADLVFYRID